MAFERVIDPRETRATLVELFHKLSDKLSEPRPKRKHGLIQM